MAKILFKHFKDIEGNVVNFRLEDKEITVAENLEPMANEVIIDGHYQKYISNGWIDIHTHCLDKFELYGDKIDEIGYKQGVTCVVDAGTCGSDDFEEFLQQANASKTKAYSWLNIAKCGIAYQNELADLSLIDKNAIAKTLEKHRHKIIGLKVRMSRSVVKESKDEPLYIALDLANEFKLPLMVHIGNPPSLIETVMENVRCGDIVTHIFNPKDNSVLDKMGKVKKEVFEAKQRGVLFDLGHGTESFGFNTCKSSLSQGLMCDTISSDIYFHNRLEGPVYCLADVMSKMVEVGYSLKEVIDMVTIKPKQYLHLPTEACDFTIFEVRDDDTTGIDSIGVQQQLHQHIVATAVIIDGEYIELEG